ncbi:MAG: DUF368 domain-containing protein [Clostridia bacterium]|nr:DUF368 domain-containing protein [Clostridia bacterium]
MRFVLDFCKGILIGAGCILPGISSGVLCVVFGIYEKLLDSILNFFTDIRKNFKFLFPIVSGGLVGMVIFSKILQYLLYKFPMQTKSIFIGLILGGVVLLFKEISTKEKFKIKNLFYLIISLIIGIMMVYFENKLGIEVVENASYMYLIFSGFLMSIGIVVPGVSSTIILMLLGIYSLYLSAISSICLYVLIPMAIGVFLGALVFMKIIKYLLDKFYIQTMFAIIGFTIGSIFVLLPDVYSIVEVFIVALCVLLGYWSISLLN